MVIITHTSCMNHSNERHFLCAVCWLAAVNAFTVNLQNDMQIGINSSLLRVAYSNANAMLFYALSSVGLFLSFLLVFQAKVPAYSVLNQANCTKYINILFCSSFLGGWSSAFVHHHDHSH